MQLNAWTSQISGWFGEIVVSSAAGATMVLMLVPLTLFLTACWLDQSFIQPRRRKVEGDEVPFDRHEAARQRRAAQQQLAQAA